MPEFNPTAGIPKISFGKNDSPSFDNCTWFSTVQPTDNLRTFSPNKGKNMNATTNTTPEGAGISDVKHFHIDAEGNRVEIPFDVTSDGEAAPAETAFIAEDGADHPIH